MKILGFELKRTSKQEQEDKLIQSIAPPERELQDADAILAGGINGVHYEVDASRENEGQLINRYRSMLLHPEVDSAVADICNEAVVYNEDRKPVGIELADLNISDSVKKKIDAEFNNILDMLNFSFEGHELFKRWYVDSKLSYHIIINKEKPEDGILELRRLDPRRLRKVTKIIEEEDVENNTKLVTDIQSYYIYNQSLQLNQGGASANMTSPAIASPTSGFKDVVISEEAILNITSGLTDTRKNRIIGHLHKAIRPLNQLKMMEDALVIYRFSRAPERRAFYVDVGSLPKIKAEQYIQNLMARYKQKMVYDSETGSIRSENKHETMLQDFWLPRREGGRGTEVSTISGGQNLSQIEDIEFFEKKLYKSLNVPWSRIQQDTGFSLGRASEITRDEVKFARFIDVLRTQFAQLFIRALRTQLVLKKVITLGDWEKILENKIRFKWAEDSFFTELKQLEILQERVRVVDAVKEYVGVYFTHEDVQKTILNRTDSEIKRSREQLEKEKNDPFYAPPEEENNMGGFG